MLSVLILLISCYGDISGYSGPVSGTLVDPMFLNPWSKCPWLDGIPFGKLTVSDGHNVK